MLVEPEDPADDAPREVWFPLGTLKVPARTSRSVVIDMVLKGQHDDDGRPWQEGTEVPQIPKDAGESGELLALSLEHLGERVPFSARQTIVFEVGS